MGTDIVRVDAGFLWLMMHRVWLHKMELVRRSWQMTGAWQRRPGHLPVKAVRFDRLA